MAAQTQQLQALQQGLQDALAAAEARAAANAAAAATAAAVEQRSCEQAAALAESRRITERLSGEVQRLMAVGNDDRAAVHAAERRLAAQAQVTLVVGEQCRRGVGEGQERGRRGVGEQRVRVWELSSA